MNAREDAVLLAMFDAELETHMSALNEGLIALEQDPSQSQWYEPMMRAAHSIKGASDLFDLKGAVRVSHVIEDTFTSARAGRLAISSELVDVLLAGVDLLGRVTRISEGTDDHADDISLIVSLIEQAAQGIVPNKNSPSFDSTLFTTPGALDAEWAGYVHQDIGKWLETGKDDLTISLDQVDHVDPTGLAMLAIASNPSQHNGRLLLKNAPPELASLLTVMGFHTALEPIC